MAHTFVLGGHALRASLFGTMQSEVTLLARHTATDASGCSSADRHPSARANQPARRPPRASFDLLGGICIRAIHLSTSAPLAFTIGSSHRGRTRVAARRQSGIRQHAQSGRHNHPELFSTSSGPLVSAPSTIRAIHPSAPCEVTPLARQTAAEREWLPVGRLASVTTRKSAGTTARSLFRRRSGHPHTRHRPIHHRPIHRRPIHRRPIHRRAICIRAIHPCPHHPSAPSTHPAIRHLHPRHPPMPPSPIRTVHPDQRHPHPGHRPIHRRAICSRSIHPFTPSAPSTHPRHPPIRVVSSSHPHRRAIQPSASSRHPQSRHPPIRAAHHPSAPSTPSVDAPGQMDHLRRKRPAQAPSAKRPPSSRNSSADDAPRPLSRDLSPRPLALPVPPRPRAARVASCVTAIHRL
jgi:hypothetical protein